MDKTSDTCLKNICLKSDFEGIVVHLIEGFIESKQTKKNIRFRKKIMLSVISGHFFYCLKTRHLIQNIDGLL